MRTAFILCCLAVAPFNCGLLLAQELILVNEQGKNLPPEIGGLSPFSVLELQRGGETIESCNAFHLELAEGNYLVTAGHCAMPSRVKDAEMVLHYFDSRTLKQSRVNLSTKDVVYGGQMGEAEADPLVVDLALLDLPAAVARRLDAVKFAASSKENGPYKVWAFEYRRVRDPKHVADVLNDRDRAVFKTVSCEGKAHEAPRILLQWVNEGLVRHEKKVGVSHSKKGIEADEKAGLFLDRCELSHGMSGALVTNAKNEGIAILHTAITSQTVRNIWNQGLRLSFAKDTIKTLGGGVELDKGEYRFATETDRGIPEPFNIDSNTSLYSVALLLSEFKRVYFKIE